MTKRGEVVNGREHDGAQLIEAPMAQGDADRLGALTGPAHPQNIRIVISERDIERAARADPLAPISAALSEVARVAVAGFDRPMKTAATAALAPINARLADLAAAVGAIASADIDRVARVAAPDLEQVLRNIRGTKNVF